MYNLFVYFKYLSIEIHAPIVAICITTFAMTTVLTLIIRLGFWTRHQSKSAPSKSYRSLKPAAAKTGSPIRLVHQSPLLPKPTRLFI